MLVVTMTSWTKRIEFCANTLLSILDSTVKPDKIFLNLSKEEFPNGCNDLPEELVEIANKFSYFVKLNWVDGPNTKSFKKIFPCLQFLENDDIIINTDDDVVFDRCLIESRLNDFNKYNGKCAISANLHMIPKFRSHEFHTLSPTSIFKKKFFNNWEKIITDLIISTCNDDRAYVWLCWLNGIRIETCSDFSVTRNATKNKLLFTKQKNNFTALHNNYNIIRGFKFDQLMKNNVLNKQHTSYDSLWNYFNK